MDEKFFSNLTTSDQTFAPDPFPILNEQKKTHVWIYGRAEREVFRQQQLIREKNKAELKVGYPGDFMQPHSKMFFRAEFPTGVFRINCIGVPALSEIRIDQPKVFEFSLSVQNVEADIPCFSCSADVAWESSFDGINWFTATGIAGTEIPPHRTELSRFKLTPLQVSKEMYDFEREVFGYVYIRNAQNAQMYVGESLPEAQNRNPEHFEQLTDLVQESPDTLRSAVPLAFRYVSTENAENAEVFAEALYTPLPEPAKFSCQDDELDAIWQRSVYTLRLCTRHFMLDGIKRDRLPWAGDLAVSLLSMTESFNEPSPIRNTLAVLGSAGIRNSHINGIFDYTLWYLINFDLYMEHFRDLEFLRQEYFRIVETAELLLAQRLPNGLLPVSGWVLIDWASGDKNCALQMLFYMALKALANLAKRMEDADREKLWDSIAEELKIIIHRDFYDTESGLFRCSPGKNEFLRHQNFLAVGSVASVSESRRIAEHLLKNDLPAVGTPYMKSFEIMALIRAGFKHEAAEEIRRFWGGMMKEGATTFFEAYGEGKTGTGLYDFYNRPFGLSLCHAWSSAPAFLLPMIFNK